MLGGKYLSTVWRLMLPSSGSSSPRR